MGILSWILLGLVAGAIAKALKPGRDPQGCIVTMIIGVVGAVLGGWIATMLGWGRVDGFNLYSILVATGGAFLALLIWGAVSGNRNRRV
ncbi:MAG: GlsB/YeaQ/YmgE family stress response membrane protein [Chitinophagaceae bacterium]|nr:MAG: GlsB/YeaQ/YmgE family stress response membrane protein [Chitinophagaceae bacterium]